MPIKVIKKGRSGYVQWGQHGHKYPFHDLRSYNKAYELATRQARAAYAHGYRHK